MRGDYGRDRGGGRVGLSLLIVLMLALMGVLLVACGGDDNTTVIDDETTAVTEATEGAVDAGGPDGGATVTMQGIAFNPDTIEVSVGDTVTWTNGDGVDHDVTAGDGSFDSGTVAPGETFSYTFDEAGTYDYVCTIHPGMTGTVEVTE